MVAVILVIMTIYDDGFSTDSSLYYFDFAMVSLNQLDIIILYSKGVSVSDGVQIFQKLKVTSTKKTIHSVAHDDFSLELKTIRMW